mgnify:CR=1 FL=1
MNLKDDGITLALTGASGAQYGLRLLECLLKGEHPVHLLISDAARVVIGTETTFRLPGRNREAERTLTDHFSALPGQLRVLGQSEWTAACASGSGAPRRMVVCPCTTGTLAGLAAGVALLVALRRYAGRRSRRANRRQPHAD